MENKLVKLQLRRLHQMEVPKLVSRFIVDYEASKIKSTDEDFKRLFSRLKTNLETFVAMERPISQHKDKAALRQADTVRDDDVKALATGIRAFRNSKRSDEIEAYRTLSMLMKSYREITKHNYEEESFAVEDLLKKLKEEPYQTSVTTLNLTKFVANLTETQKQFEALFDKTTTKQAHQVKTAQINQARKALLEEYQHLCEYVENMVWAKGSEPYKKTLTLMNKGRKFYVEMIQRRTGKDRNPTLPEEKVSESEMPVTKDETALTVTSEEAVVTAAQEEDNTLRQA